MKMEEELIEAVRNFKVLYDTEDPDYMKPELKMAIWTRIAQELKFNHGNEAKRYWEKLRNNHRDALRRQKHAKSKSGSRGVKPWRYQKQMEFLLPLMANRYTKMEDADNLEVPDDVSQDIGNDHSPDEVNILKVKQSVSSDSNEGTDEDVTSMDHNDPISLESPKRKRIEIKKKTYIHTLLKRSRARKMEMMKKAVGNSNVFDVDKSTRDPLLHFFISMYESTKKMPLTSQHKIKNSLFKIVSEEEEKQFISPA